MHLDFDLALWGDAVEATAAGVAVDGYYAESVARIFTDAFECLKRPFVDKCLERF